MSISMMKRLSFKLPMFVSLVIVIVAGLLATLTYLDGKAFTLQQAESRLGVLAESRELGLTDWYNSIDAIAKTLARNNSTADAMVDFKTNFLRLDDAGRQDVQRAYTVLNPFGVGERDGLDRAEGESFYHVAHERHHRNFRYFNDTNAFYDTFLVDLEGNIVYSVFKESDFGENVVTGELAQSGIGETFQMSMADSSDTSHQSSFGRYGPSNGAVAGFVSARIYDGDGQHIGVLILQLNIDEFANVFNSSQGLDETGEAFIVNEAGQVLIPSRFEDGFKAFDTLPITDHIAAALSGNTVETRETIGVSHQSVSAVAIPVDFDGTQYAMVVEQANNEILSHVISERNRTIVLSLVLVGVMGLLAALYIRLITNLLQQLQLQMQQVADGDFDVDVAAVKRDDEIGDIGRALVDFKTKLNVANEQAKERELGQIEQQDVLDVLRNGLVGLAEGDLTKPISQEFEPQYESLRADFNETLRTLNEAISNVVRVTDSIRHGANEISQASDDLSNRTENQAATLEQTAAALDELTASVRSAADGAKSVETIVIEAQSEAENSGKIVANAIAAMTEIENSSEQISQIIGVIDDIAFQTNLLALNAGVEAARAGEAGKGFAVVASEVRALAQRSSDAAKEIKTLISGSAKQVERGVDLVGGAGTALGNIVERVTHISELIRNIANGSSEQAIGLGEINIGVNQLDQVTQQNAAMVEEATAASHVLKSDAVQLQEMVSRFNTQSETGSGPSHSSQAAPSSVIPVQFQRSRDTQRNDPAPVPIAVGEGPRERSMGAENDGDWHDF